MYLFSIINLSEPEISGIFAFKRHKILIKLWSYVKCSGSDTNIQYDFMQSSDLNSLFKLIRFYDNNNNNNKSKEMNRMKKKKESQDKTVYWHHFRQWIEIHSFEGTCYRLYWLCSKTSSVNSRGWIDHEKNTDDDKLEHATFIFMIIAQCLYIV